MPLTDNQKEKLKKAILEGKVTDKTTLQIFNLVSDLEEKVESLTNDLKQEVEKSIAEVKASEVSLDKVLASIKGQTGETGATGQDGKTPTTEELLLLVKPLIPEVKDGHTPTKKELTNLILPLIPEPRNGLDGINPSPEEVVPLVLEKLPKVEEETPEQTRDKLEKLKGDERLDIKFIKGLEDLFKKGKGKTTQMIAGGARFINQLFDVKLTSLANNDVLKWDDTNKLWVNGTGGGGSGDMTEAVYDPSNISEQLVGLTATQTLTNKRITKRVVTAADATSITPTGDTADWTEQANTQATGTLTINAPTGSPTSHQAWGLNIKSTNVQTFSWNAIFVGGTNPLPTATTGGGKWDYYTFIYNSTSLKWYYTGSAINFT